MHAKDLAMFHLHIKAWRQIGLMGRQPGDIQDDRCCGQTYREALTRPTRPTRPLIVDVDVVDWNEER